MSESPSQPPARSDSGTGLSQYWCYQCNKRVSIETLPNLPDIVCYECKSGFVESITAPAHPTAEIASGFSDPVDDPNFGSQFLQMLRLIAQAANDEDVPPPPPPPQSPPEDDFLRIELEGWDNDVDDDDDDPNGAEFHRGGEEENEADQDGDRSDNEDGENRDDQERTEDEDRRRRRDVFRLRIRDFVTRGRSGRNRIMDWAEILMGLDENSIEFRLEVPESDRYIGNAEDYVDATGYETLLQTLAESDSGGRRGAPPAAKSAVMELPTVEVLSQDDALVCAICKDMVNVGKTAKKLPCGHRYHGDCIVPWLESRNSCPVCRFELPTDDPEYEDHRKKKAVSSAGASGSRGGNSFSD